VLQFVSHRSAVILHNMVKERRSRDMDGGRTDWSAEMQVYVEKLESTMPALGEVAIEAYAGREVDGDTWLEVLEVAEWILNRAEEVQAMLQPHETIEPDEGLDPGPEAWKTVRWSMS